MIKNLDQVAHTLGLDSSALKTAIESTEEVDINISDLAVFKKIDYETRIKNLGTEKYNEGKTAGVEMEWKEVKRKFGLDIEGKDQDVILNGLKAKILSEANIAPNEQIKEKQKEIDQLRANLNEAIGQTANLKTQYELNQKQSQLNQMLFNAIPEQAVNESLTRNDIVALFKANGYDVDIVEGKTVVKKGSDVLKHTVTLEPLPYTDVLKSFIEEKKLIKPAGGRGGIDLAGRNGELTTDEFTELMKKQGITINSAQYFEAMQQMIKDKKLKT